MSKTPLAHAVERFANVTQSASLSDLERPWAWGAYDSEGVRFAFFRTYEELRELTVRLIAGRAMQARPMTLAQRILAQYHIAHDELEALLLGLSDEALQRKPAEDEWSIQQVVAHMARTDIGFFVGIRYSLDTQRTGNALPVEIPDEIWENLIGLSASALNEVMSSSFAGLWVYHSEFHERILSEFATLTDQELDLPSVYWEPAPMPIRFRLHRFDSHTRQHTVQVEKTLFRIGQAPSEAKMLLRLIYSALGEAESACLGVQKVYEPLALQTAQAITTRADEVATILAK